jgi:hypothetical protein
MERKLRIELQSETAKPFLVYASEKLGTEVNLDTFSGLLNWDDSSPDSLTTFSLDGYILSKSEYDEYLNLKYLINRINDVI